MARISRSGDRRSRSNCGSGRGALRTNRLLKPLGHGGFGCPHIGGLQKGDINFRQNCFGEVGLWDNLEVHQGGLPQSSQDGMCGEHGEVEGSEDLRLMMVIDSGVLNASLLVSRSLRSL